MTFIELLVSLLLLAILFCFGLPSLKIYEEKNTLNAVVNDVNAAVRYSRLLASLYNISMMILPLVPNHWEKGLIICQYNEKHLCNQDASFIYQWQWFIKNLQVNWQGFNQGNFMLFSADLTKATMNGRFKIILGKQKEVFLVINRVGRVRVKGSRF